MGISPGWGWLLLPVCQALVVPREVSGRAGETVSLHCWYPRGYEDYNKYWCQGASWDSCRKVVETAGREVPRQRGRVSIQDNHVFCVVRLTVENLSEADAGSYWCGVERMGRDLMEPVTVRVVPAVSAPPAASLATPTPWVSTAMPERPPTSNVTAVGPGGPALSALVPSVVLLSLLVAAGSVGLLWTLRRRRAALRQPGIATELAHGSVYDNELDLAEVRAPGVGSAGSTDSLDRGHTARLLTLGIAQLCPRDVLSPRQGGCSGVEQHPELQDDSTYSNMLPQEKVTGMLSPHFPGEEIPYLS